MTLSLPRVAGIALLGLLSGCGAAPAAAAGDFSVVAGVPPEWVPRLDEARYLEGSDCAVLCPTAFAKRVTSCHLARVAGAKTSPDTAAVVCNGSAEPEKP